MCEWRTYSEWPTLDPVHVDKTLQLVLMSELIELEKNKIIET